MFPALIRNFASLSLLACLTVGIAFTSSCKRKESAPPSVVRVPRMAGPTSESLSKESRAKQMADLTPIPALEDPKTQVAPDGEVWTRYSNGLMIHILHPSSDGLSPELGQRVKVTYIGTFPGSNKEFDRAGPSNPYTFRLGSSSVVKGFSQGISTMHVGEKRRIFLPPDLAYGPNGNIEIPGNQALIFEVELLDISGQSVEFKIDDLALPQPLGPPAPTTSTAPDASTKP